MQLKVLETAWWPELSVFSTPGCSVSQTFWLFFLLLFFFHSAHWFLHNRKFWLIILEIKYHSTLNHRRVGYISSSSQSSCLSHLLLPEEEPWTSQDLRCKKHKLHNTKSVEIHLIAQSFPCWVNRLVCSALKKRALRRTGAASSLTSVMDLQATKRPPPRSIFGQLRMPTFDWVLPNYTIWLKIRIGLIIFSKINNFSIHIFPKRLDTERSEIIFHQHEKNPQNWTLHEHKRCVSSDISIH